MKDYKQYYIIAALPDEVFIALSNPSTIQLWSGEKCEISTEPGSTFSFWEESITGINISFETGKKIVQEWDFGEQVMPSVVTIILHPHKHGTSAELRHTNIPGDDYQDIVLGWNDIYFKSLIDFYEN